MSLEVTPEKRQNITTDLKKDVGEITNYILNTADYTRKDRLWPAHYKLFNTNPLSIAYGASGIALFLQKAQGKTPERVQNWLKNHKMDTQNYPPGLYVGLSGIAYTFLNIELEDEAKKIINKTYGSPLLHREANMFNGAAGWGLISLYFFNKLEEEIYLKKATEAGKYIINSAQKKEGGYCWRYNYEDEIYFGFGYGASGISLFLLYLFRATNNETFLDYAIKGLDFDLKQKKEDATGLTWSRYKEDSLNLPYWIHGAAGVGTTAIRFYYYLQDEKYKKLAEQIAKSVYIKFSVLPSLFQGLSGIGEFMIDMYRYTNEKKYLDWAFDIAESVSWFGIKKDNGLAFPGRWLNRISNDYGTGSAGIGLFFLRLLKPDQEKRLFHDI